MTATAHDLQIVAAGSERVAEVKPLFLSLHAHHRACAPGAAAVATFREDEDAWERRCQHYVTLLESARGHLLIAAEAGELVGYAVVSETGGQTSLATGGRMAELETLSVTPGGRGAGIGTALMDAVYKLIRSLQIEEVMLYVMDGNNGALRFYERRGMQPYLTVLLGRVPAG